jgi:MFS family permease
MDPATAKETEEKSAPIDFAQNAIAKETEEKSAPATPPETATATERGSVMRNNLAPPSKEELDVSQGTSFIGVDDEKHQPEPEREAPPRDISGIKWAIVVLSILSSTFLFALDNTIVADIQPVIVEHFDSVGKLSWLSVAFLIGAAATNLIWGKIFGQFNGKWTYIFCVFLFEVGSALCGAAPTIDALIIGRALCGVGGSGMYVGVMTLLAATTTIHERPMYVGGTGLTWGLGTVLGPIIGGAFTDSSAGWRFSFYINLCIGAVCAPVYIFLLPNKDPRPGVSLLDRAREMDYVGAVLTMGAFVSGVMAVSFGGLTYPWNSGRIIGLFVCSGVLFILLGFQQVYTVFTTTSRRIFPVEFFKIRTILILFAMTAAGGTAIFIPIYMTPIFFQFTRGDSALESGVRLLPFILLMVFAVISNGAVLSAYGYYMPWYTVGGLLVLTGGALMYTVDSETSIARVYGYTIIIGFGDGLFAQASFSIAQAIVEPSMVASAVGFITCAQVSGVTIALAIANSVFLNKSQEGIQAILPDVSTEVIQQTIAGAGSQFFESLSGEVRAEVLTAIVTAMSKSYILVITAGSLVAVLSLAMKRERLFIAAGAAA